MRVLYITNLASPYRVDFFEELGKHCELDVTFELKPKDARGRNAGWFNHNHSHFNAIQLHQTHIKNKVVCFDILNVLKQNRYDIVVVGMYSSLTSICAILYMWIHGIKFFINSDGGFIKYNESFFQKGIKNFLIGKASYFLASSDKTGQYLQYYGGNDKKFYKYTFSTYKEKNIPAGIIKIDEKRELRKKLGIGKNELVFLSVGQFIYRKGYDLLISACKNLSDDCQVYIVGGEPTTEYLNLVSENGVKNINFLGFKSQEELIDYYKAADVFVLPTREDIWGLVIVEAYTFGLPVITTDNCLAGLELTQNGRNGFIIPVNDHQALHEKMVWCNENREKLEQMSICAFEPMKSYTIEQSVIDHLEAFYDVCDA